MLNMMLAYNRDLGFTTAMLRYCYIPMIRDIPTLGKL